MMDSIVNMASHYVMNKFNNSPPAGIIYHNLRHTKDVVHAANRIAKYSRISQDKLELLLLAAWFHDIGILMIFELLILKLSHFVFIVQLKIRVYNQAGH